MGAYLDMEIEFDPEKDATNIAKHGISLARVAEFETRQFRRIVRGGEVRVQAFGLIDGLLFTVIFTFRRNALRPISLRRARLSEVRDAAQDDQGL